MKHVTAILICVGFVSCALGNIEITEWMYNGAATDAFGEYVEFTNTGTTAVDMTGWSYDDSSRIAGTVDLSAFGTVEPGESVILTDATAADFATNWGLTGVKIIGGLTANLGRNDEINLYDATQTLVDRLTYGDEDFPGTVRTQLVSCNIPDTDYGYTEAQTSWVLATVGDAYGSTMSSVGEIGSPGVVPEPATWFVLALGVLGLRGRRA